MLTFAVADIGETVDGDEFGTIPASNTETDNVDVLSGSDGQNKREGLFRRGVGNRDGILACHTLSHGVSSLCQHIDITLNQSGILFCSE